MSTRRFSHETVGCQHDTSLPRRRQFQPRWLYVSVFRRWHLSIRRPGYVRYSDKPGNEIDLENNWGNTYNSAQVDPMFNQTQLNDFQAVLDAFHVCPECISMIWNASPE